MRRSLSSCTTSAGVQRLTTARSMPRCLATWRWVGGEGAGRRGLGAAAQELCVCPGLSARASTPGQGGDEQLGMSSRQRSAWMDEWLSDLCILLANGWGCSPGASLPAQLQAVGEWHLALGMPVCGWRGAHDAGTTAPLPACCCSHCCRGRRGSWRRKRRRTRCGARGCRRRRGGGGSARGRSRQSSRRKRRARARGSKGRRAASR